MQMSILGRFFAGDEELGKKDDDHRPAKDGLLPPTWPVRKAALRARGRSVLYGLLACLLVYLFIHNIPTDLGPTTQRPHYGSSSQGGPGPAPLVAPAANFPKPGKQLSTDDGTYDGPVKFYKLATSLHAVARLIGHRGVNKNVLFAASNLKSAAEIIPIACEMARWARNDVHFAFMGRDDLPVEEIKLVNGVPEDCKVNWHDARPDFSQLSSAARMEISVASGMGYMHTFVRPQVILADHSSREDAFFIRALRSKALEMGKSIIELPKDAATNLMWITRLDSLSLAAWHVAYVDLLIHASPDSSGSLIRLLKSIEAADYFGSRRPHLRIELPATIDAPTWNYVQNLVWPPIDWSGAAHVSQVTLRHSIPRRAPTAEEASVRLVESFYPARPRDSHVLLLSPQIELSPLYYHYLMYNILEYKYSSEGQFFKESNHLMGLSLELPTHYLNGTKVFTPPLLERSNVQGVPKQPGLATQFLWQSPNSNAALYFGDKWIEFHSFLSARLSALNSKTPRRIKLISERHPSWMEYLLELMRARGYSLLYPNFTSTGESIATLHNELYQPPEEYAQPQTSSTPDLPLPAMDPNDPFVAGGPAQSSKLPSHAEPPLLSRNLLSILPQSGDLSELTYVPIISYEGNVLSHASSDVLLSTFAAEFRRDVGECVGGGDIWIYQMSANDLFCNLNQDKYSDVSDEDDNDYETEDIAKEVPQTPASTEQKAESDFSQAEFAAHMDRQGGKPKDKEDVPAKAPPSTPAKAPGEDPGDAKKEVSDHLARQAAKKLDFSTDNTPIRGEAKSPAGGTEPVAGPSKKESHDTVVMQTDHIAGKIPDDHSPMPADHVAGKKGEDAVVKIGDKASAGEATVKSSAEEKGKKPGDIGHTKATEIGVDDDASTKKEAEIPERKPGW